MAVMTTSTRKAPHWLTNRCDSLPYPSVPRPWIDFLYSGEVVNIQ